MKKLLQYSFVLTLSIFLSFSLFASGDKSDFKIFPVIFESPNQVDISEQLENHPQIVGAQVENGTYFLIANESMSDEDLQTFIESLNLNMPYQIKDSYIKSVDEGFLKQF